MNYSSDIIQRVWEKARALADRDSTEWRQDECGAWIVRNQYGNAVSDFAWKIENVTPGGSDELESLRAMHRDNTFDRGTGKPHCRITADREGIAPTSRIGSPRNRNVDP